MEKRKKIFATRSFLSLKLSIGRGAQKDIESRSMENSWDIA